MKVSSTLLSALGATAAAVAAAPLEKRSGFQFGGVNLAVSDGSLAPTHTTYRDVTLA